MKGCFFSLLCCTGCTMAMPVASLPSGKALTVFVADPLLVPLSGCQQKEVFVGQKKAFICVTNHPQVFFALDTAVPTAQFSLSTQEGFFTLTPLMGSKHQRLWAVTLPTPGDYVLEHLQTGVQGQVRWEAADF